MIRERNAKYSLNQKFLIVRLLFLMLLVFAIGCERETGGGTTYPTDVPYIVESVLARRIADGYPQGITNEFWEGDTVNLWIEWADVVDTNYVHTAWIDPEGWLQDSLTLEITPSTRAVTSFYLILYSWVVKQGQWEVIVYLDDQFRRSHLFWVYPNLP